MKRFLLLPVILAALLTSGYQKIYRLPDPSIYPAYLRQALALQPWHPTAQAAAQGPDLPEGFVDQVASGRPWQLDGVVVPGKLALPVVQQPFGQPGYVDDRFGWITEFGLAANHGATGLLAHNTRSGRLFFDLVAGDQVALVYGDGSIRVFRVTEIYRYQALDSSNMYSDFIDLDDPTQTHQTSDEVFNRFYREPDRLVFQTCISAQGDLSWGRMFVVAEPVN